MLKASVLFTFLLLSHLLSYSQDKVITGKVTDSKDGSGLAGVTVVPKGGTGGTQTVNDGSYRLTVGPSVTVLIFSSVGFVTQEINIAGRTSIDVSMALNNTSLGEVVVIGYGTTRKKDLTGSVTVIGEKDFQKGNITTPEQLIAGRVAGVQITSNGGAPGAGSTIRIRGGASLNASNDPLIVVDGVPVDNGGISGAANALALINPNDIESFNVLKDASATAIYGARASNGVIIITTKKGRSGKPKFNFNTQLSLSTLPKKADVLSPTEFRAYVNANGTPAQIGLLGSANTDWQDAIYDNAISTDNNLSVSGAYKKIPYRLSIGFLSQDGILITGNMKRKSASLNLNPKLFQDHLRIDFNVKGSINNSRFADEGAIGNAVRFDPTKPVKSSDKRYGGYFEWLDPSSTTGLRDLAPLNPVGLLEQRTDKSEVRRSIGNMKLDYKLHFLPDLHLVVNLGYDISTGEGTVYIPDSAASSYRRSPDAKHGGVDNRYLQKKANTLLETYFNYVKDIKSINSRIDFTGGYTYQKFMTHVINAEKDPNGKLYQKADGTLDTIPTTGQRYTGFSDMTTDGYIMSWPTNPFDKPKAYLISLFGRLNYSFKDKFLLTGTIRRDASSKFSEDNWIGWFPSAAFAWKLKQESFMRNSRVISDLKLRLGYGITGQQDGIGYYDYLARYSQANNRAQYQFGNTYYQPYRPEGYNDRLKWEETTTYNAGIDFGFLNNRITGSVDVYLKQTKDLLSVIDQPAGTNFSNKILANIGTMENRGVEFTLNTQPVNTKNVSWDLGFNITYNKNEITKLTFTNDPNFPGNLTGGIAGGVGSTIQIHSVSYPKSSFYVYKQIYDKDGRPIEGLFEDLDRNGLINVDDLYRYKSPDPTVFLGAYSTVNYKKWSAGFSLRANINNYMYNNRFSNTGVKRNIIDPLGFLANGSRNLLETNFTGNGDTYLLSDYYIENASFLRMDNINIGYNAGDLVKKNTNLRIGVNVQNAFTVTKYKGVDPEVSGGIDNNFYPRPRIFVLSLNLDF
ncbi:MAG: SusC/RagA family TonB-linked outer membrane protein [Chitinophagaceae bacterium]|nr:SusC/RagA family TonB-linked outer membrane protein [Chitinophagaceae bacterium]